jgi:hypothetical protein
MLPAFPHGYDGASLLGICFRRRASEAASCAGGLQASSCPFADDAFLQLSHDSAELKNRDAYIILCTHKDSSVVRFSVLHENEQLFATKYKLVLPSEDELRAELDRERALLAEHSRQHGKGDPRKPVGKR